MGLKKRMSDLSQKEDRGAPLFTTTDQRAISTGKPVPPKVAPGTPLKVVGERKYDGKKYLVVEQKDKRYMLISRNDPELLEDLKAKLDTVERFGFDFETTSANPLSLVEPQITVGISFSTAIGVAFYLPIHHDSYGANWDESVLQEFRPYFEHPTKLKVAFNANFEAHWLRKVGITLTMPIFDPMLAINQLKLLYSEIGLKAVVEQVFGYKMITYDEITGFVITETDEFYKSGDKKGKPKMDRRQRKFNEVPMDARALEYTCADSDWALQLVDPVTEQLKQAGLYELVTEIDIPLMLALVDMELNGWHTDRTQFDKFRALAEAKLAELEPQIKAEISKQLRIPFDAHNELVVPVGKTHKPFNINSSDHLCWLLFDQLKLPVINRSKKTKEPSADADTFEKLEKKIKIPLFRLILDYKKYTKLLSTYVEGYSQFLTEADRLHSTIDQVFVRTGRFSSSKPNLQNCPKAQNDPLGIRNIFMAPAADHAITGEDTVFILCDYSQIELRIFAWYSRDPNMLDAFAKGQDIHSRTAWQMFELGKTFLMPDGTPHEAITVEQVKEVAKVFRDMSKSINFGIIYGMQAQGLANDIWNNDDAEHIRKAQGLLNRYYIQYPGVIAYQKEQIGFARRHGYSVTMFGRQRPLPEINNHNPFKRSGAERQAMNTPIQGCKVFDSVVWTDKGLYCIGDLYERGTDGLRVFTGNGFSPFKATFSGDKEETVITLSDGSHIEGSPDHRYLAYTAGELTWKRAHELTTDDWLVRPDIAIQEVAEITGEDTLHYDMSQFVVTNSTITHELPEIMTPELAEILGYLVANGSYSGKELRWIYGYKEVELRDYHRALLKTVFPTGKLYDGLQPKEKHHPVYSLNMRSIYIQEFLRQIGLGKNTARDKKVPHAIMQSSFSCRCAFLRGLFSGDGHSSASNYVSYTTVSKTLAYQVQQLLQSIGIFASARHYPTCYRVNIPSYSSIRFGELVGFSSSYKQERFTQLVKPSSKSGQNNLVPQHLLKLCFNEMHSSIPGLPNGTQAHVFRFKQGSGSLESLRKFRHLLQTENTDALLNYQYLKVTNIERTGRMVPMYDIEVLDEQHQFVCDGVLTHNSASEIIKLAMVRIYQQVPEWLKMVIQIHDELIFEVPVSHVIEAVSTIKGLMEQPIPDFDVPIVAEASIAHYWGAKQDLMIAADGTLSVKKQPSDPIFADRLARAGVLIAK